MLRVAIATMFRNDQTIILAEILDLFTVGGPQRWPTMDENESLLGFGIDIEICEVEAARDGLGVGRVRSVCGRAVDVLLQRLEEEGIEVDKLSIVDGRDLKGGSGNAQAESCEKECLDEHVIVVGWFLSLGFVGESKEKILGFPVL